MIIEIIFWSKNIEGSNIKTNHCVKKRLLIYVKRFEKRALELNGPSLAYKQFPIR